jgi:hypothetical protein
VKRGKTKRKEKKMYSVIDIRTGEIVGSYKSRKLADRKADKLDMEYGAVRYVVRFTNEFSF